MSELLMHATLTNNRAARRREFVPERWEIVGEDGTRFNVRVCADFAARERAYRLAWRVYHNAGYAPGTDDGMLVSPFDALPDTLTILVEDEQGRDAATITLNFDSAYGLPSDEMYVDDLFGYRLNARRLAEVSRLALDHGLHRHSKAVLTCIFNFVISYARDVERCTDLAISVNPRHVEYYRRLLCFEPIAEERPCPRVQGAPAILMRLDLAMPARAREELRRDPSVRPFARTLYPRFYAEADEARAMRYLSASRAPMSRAEAARFGIAPLSLNA